MEKLIIASLLLIVAIVIRKQKSLFWKIAVSFFRWASYRLNLVTLTSLLLTICILITIVLGFFLYWSKTVPDVLAVLGEQIKSGAIFETILRAGQNGKLGEGILYGISVVFDVLEGEGDELRAGFPNHSRLTWIVCFLIPVLTVITAIASLAQMFPLCFLPRKEYLIFSQAAENSICMAESMMYAKGRVWPKLYWSRKVIFLRTERNQLSTEQIARIKQIKARVCRYSESDLLRIHWGLRKRRLRFFFLSSNTDQNFSQMKAFLDNVEKGVLFSNYRFFGKSRREQDEQKGIFRQELYLLSETESAPLLIDHLRMKLCLWKNAEETYSRKTVFQHTDLRLLDRYRTVMYDLLQQKPLYECAQEKKIRVLVLGFGRVGKAFLRAAMSFCAMADYQTSFHVIDSDMDRQWHDLILQYPECQKDISVRNDNMNVESEELLVFLDGETRGGRPFTYIVLSLGDDERNIKVASRIARYYRKKYWENKEVLLPDICVNLEDKIKSDYVSSFFKKLQPARPLYVFGADNHTFSEEMLINRPLWTVARRLHSNLKNDDFAYWNEYERRSSIACVAHASYHTKAMESYSGKIHDHTFETLRTEQRHKMVESEHIRWMRYSRSEGMQHVSPETAERILKEMNNHVDVDARLTPCLVPTNELDDLYKRLYPNAKRTNQERAKKEKAPHRTFIERDQFVVTNAFRIQQSIECRSDINFKQYEEQAKEQEC